MIEEEKVCTKCEKKKSIEAFSKDKYARDNHSTRCKSCDRVYNNSEKGKEAKKRYKQTDKFKRTQKKYGQSNKVKLRQREYGQSERGRDAKRQYDQSERGKESHKRYRQSEKGKRAIKRFWQSEKGKRTKKKNDTIRRTRKTQVGGFYTSNQWFKLCKFYDFHCLRCHQQFSFDKLTVDHIKPVTKGGSSFIYNLQCLCGSCNSIKGDKEIDYRKILPPWLTRDIPIWVQDRLF